jgi:hypothetical protein
MRELDDSVPSLRRPHHQLTRHRPTAGVERQGLFGGEASLRSETPSEVDRAKLPVGSIPSRAFALRIVWAAWDEPAL